METDQAQRMTQSFTAAWEKRNLPRIAHALPAWVTPDHLTTLGVVASAVVGLGYLLAHLSPAWLILSIGAIAIHWFADSLDGTLARVRQRERERYGYYVDRTADAISTVIICSCVGLSPFARAFSGLALAVGYLLLQNYAEICAYTLKRFPLSFGRLGPTEARIGLAAVNLLLIFWQPPQLSVGTLSFNWLDLALLVFGFGFVATYAVLAIRGAKQLAALERAILKH